jgi:hypothetical protein
MSRLPEEYPDAPCFKAPGPSEEAAERVAGQAKVLRAKVIAAYQERHPAGFTADEVAAELNQSILSVRPRVSELRRSGDLIDTGQRRPNESGLKATVWRYNPPVPTFGDAA